MSGPIVRTGPTPEFSKGWDRIFSKGSKSQGAAPKTKSAAKDKPAKSAGKSAKAVAKKAKQKSKKK